MGQRNDSVVVDLEASRRRRTRNRGPDPALALTLLGGFALEVADEVVDVPAGAQRLVALLALRGRTSRSRLAGTLWPETTEHRALASLRTAIWRVNQVADRLVACTSGTVDLGAGVDVDVRRLVRGALVMLRERPTGAVEDAQDLLEDGDELLPDWEDEWLLAERERLRQMRLHVLETIAARLSVSGHHGLALEAALAALRVDPLRESAHRAVIRIHLAEGNVAEARRAFDQCCRVLVRDVGVEPSAATSGLLPRAPRSPGQVHSAVRVGDVPVG
ncbi:AfsR/SARP family transcriptional regulator [Pseudonocardia nigra]|uniref:AfsR/SARP family transcriptional regulator n=1 Tax=Pseudonocardia nigra TaxID=1921578 RepID=UPI001C5EA486|nr:BTAD domain-containing putative transcriptional regulator [Pseudonocardia nigra]